MTDPAMADLMARAAVAGRAEGGEFHWDDAPVWDDDWRDVYRNDMRAALVALTTAGYVIIPRASLARIHAIATQPLTVGTTIQTWRAWRDEIAGILEGMLAAAPPFPPEEKSDAR